MKIDAGLFGPGSASWQVHGELTVLFGGARALLMQSAHPLVIAGARETGFYLRSPWKRLNRTLLLNYLITFGTIEEARAAAEHINVVHRRVHGVDPVTGQAYHGLDPDLLLWVHATLVESALLFEKLTVGKLDAAGRQRFHEEQMKVAELLELPREKIPPTVDELMTYMRDLEAGDTLVVTDAARTVAGLMRSAPPEAEWKPVVRLASWWAFASLPAKLREAYGVTWSRPKEAAVRASLAGMKAVRPFIPRRYRRLLIAEAARLRVSAEPD
ncbi:MAG TPA: oxygenase MpaB family protein [Actinomycetota bacterium]